jgi:hypothetical protein
MINSEAEKILRYKNLTVEIHRAWDVKTKVLPEITGTTGPISKPYRKHLGNIPGNNEIKELQKTAILCTVRVLRKVLM